MVGLRCTSSGANISADGKYRYALWREWRGTPNAKWTYWKDDKGAPVLDGGGNPIGEPDAAIFIMLNPSIADAKYNDPTIRKCVGFARRWGYDRLVVLNLFAYRVTDPRELLRLTHVDDPVGINNSDYVSKYSDEKGIIVCAWGAHGKHLGQDETLRGWLPPHRPLYCLGRTKHGLPRHPLMVPYYTELEQFT